MESADSADFIDIHGEFDIDALLDVDLDALLDESWIASDAPPVAAEEEAESGSGSASASPGSDLWMSEIEKFLLTEDEDVGGDSEEFSRDLFSDLFADAVEGAGDAVEEEEEKDREVAVSASAGVEEEDDPVSKKRKRQIRNRDSASKSRERKNQYVKDLEMKSKYFQSECQRLDFTLRCCMAENMALRQSLLKPLGALVSKQESAVLIMESLLLGSLFWLMSIVCLFLLPVLPIPKQKDVSRLVGNSVQEVMLKKNIANEELGPRLGFKLVMLRRRCRGMRTKMRTMFLPSASYFSLGVRCLF